MTTNFDLTEETQYDDYVPPKDEIRQEKDFILDKILLVAFNGAEYDVSPLNVSLKIYEDIFSNYIYGTITLVDSSDLIQLLPIIGEEWLKISFTRPGIKEGSKLEYINVAFRVFRLTNRKLQNDRTQIYTLNFVSPEYIKNLKSRSRISFKDKKWSEMVQILFNEKIKIDKPLIVEDTEFEYDFAIPSHKPYQFFNYAAGRSVPKDVQSFFLFYEDREQFNFVSLNKLLEQEPVEKYIHHVANVLDKNLHRTIEQDLVAAEQYEFGGSFDILNNLVTGMYSSKLITYDPVRRKIETEKFDYKEYFKKKKKLSKNDICTDGLDALGSPDSCIKVLMTNKDHDKVAHIVAKEPGINPFHVEDTVLVRFSQMQQFNNTRIRIRVSGDPRRKAGQVIEFELPSSTGDTWRHQEKDKYLNGKYLITAICHTLVQKEYFLEMELVTDSFLSEISHVDPIEFYRENDDTGLPQLPEPIGQPNTDIPLPPSGGFEEDL